MTLVHRPSLWASATTWAFVGAAFLAVLCTSWLIGVTSSGLAGMQANEICAEAGLGYHADAVITSQARSSSGWPFAYPCSRTTDAVPGWVNPAITVGLIGAPVSWVCAAVISGDRRKG